MAFDDVTCWQLAPAANGALGRTDAVVALRAEDIELAERAGRPSVPFHATMTGQSSVRPAREVVVQVPQFRGHRLLPVLSWLVTARLARPGAAVTWRVDRRQGPDTVRRLLAELGWTLDGEREQQTTLLRGAAPVSQADPPKPLEFRTVLAGREVDLYADYGVFSPTRIDDGTAQLLAVAAELLPTVDVVADIGIGYGVLALGLVLAGTAKAAVGTDVDAIALWLAAENAARLGVAVDMTCSPDPTTVPDTAVTVCNVPTHINEVQTDALMAGLVARARTGRLLTVVHASLEQRYLRRLQQAGLRVRIHPGPKHSILDAEF